VSAGLEGNGWRSSVGRKPIPSYSVQAARLWSATHKTTSQACRWSAQRTARSISARATPPPDLLDTRLRRLIGPAPDLDWTWALWAHATPNVGQPARPSRVDLEHPS
jgi:hypothetical protein